MKTIKKRCLYCDKPIIVLLKEHKRGNGKFCNNSCAARYQKRYIKKIPNVTCSYCGLLFYKNASKQKNSKSGLFFCCREHKDLAQRIGGIKDIMPPHYNDGKSKYRKSALNAYPNACNRCGYSEHPDILVVHHKDRNRSNNDISNLEVLCPNCHEAEHLLNNDGRFWSKRQSDQKTSSILL